MISSKYTLFHNMKTLKFKNDLVPKILDGSKSVTWRLFDDKDLQVGDELLFINSDSQKEFTTAQIIEIREKKLGEITKVDFEKHENSMFGSSTPKHIKKYKNQEEMLASFRIYYGDKIDLSSIVKIIKFKLL